ncbi:unnamed protein product [Adineta ricciae]|uniref:Uncharacterized protein n=1 Tax=Adineta ricciae TaxID=249248 RepID=A0A814VBH6_ADIRI|nr:unnamed protein product [Adineta ricciae]
MVQVSSICKSIVGFGRKTKTYLEDLNLFSSIPPSTDEHQLQQEKISTKLFLTFLITLMLILLLYTSLVDNTQTISIPAPSLVQYSRAYSKYQETLTCPCTKITIGYSKFLQIDYKLYQVCSSVLVTQDWFNYLTAYHLTGQLYLYDYRSVINKIFQGWSTLCNLTTERISDDLDISNPSAIINPAISLANNSRFSFLNFVNSTNKLFAGVQTNANFSTTPELRLITTPTTYNNCSCDLSPKCTHPARIDDFQGNATLWTIPGFYIGCFLIESLLQSNLQCFFNQSCIDQLQVYLDISSTMNITQLNRSLLKNFQMNSIVEELVNNLMVEQWNSSISFDNYYSECQPAQCIYTDKMRNSATYIVTTIIGLIGGLVMALKLIVPRVVMFFGKTRNNVERMEMTERIRVNLKKFRDYFKNFSTFRSLNHSDALKCPCTKISVNYKQILSIEYQFHEICSSTFLNHDWIVHISQCDVQYRMYCNDFRCSGPYYFQTMLSYCQMVKKTISDSLTQFYSNQYISSSVIAYNVFESQVSEFIAQFISSTTNSFLLSILTIRGTTYSNGLLVGLLYNFLLEVDTITNQITLPSETYDDCYCDHTSTCTASSDFYLSLTGVPLLIIPGFKKSCFMIDSVLGSTLECFYNRTCIDQIKTFYSVSSAMDMIPLNASSLTSFTVNSTMKEVTDELMVNQWKKEILYANYFNQCAPSQCTYIYTIKNTVLYIITTIIGLTGGLITALRFIVPKVVKFVRGRIQKRKNRVSTIRNTIRT